MLSEKNRIQIFIIGGMAGSFSAHAISGFCIWLISVSPDFLPLYYIVYLFPAPLVLGGVASLMYGWQNIRQNTFRVFFFAFSSTLLSNLLTFLLAPLLGTSIIGELINLNNLILSRFYFMTLEIFIGIFFMVTFVAAHRLFFGKK